MGQLRARFHTRGELRRTFRSRTRVLGCERLSRSAGPRYESLSSPRMTRIRISRSGDTGARSYSGFRFADDREDCRNPWIDGWTSPVVVPVPLSRPRVRAPTSDPRISRQVGSMVPNSAPIQRQRPVSSRLLGRHALPDGPFLHRLVAAPQLLVFARLPANHPSLERRQLKHSPTSAIWPWSIHVRLRYGNLLRTPSTCPGPGSCSACPGRWRSWLIIRLRCPSARVQGGALAAVGGVDRVTAAGRAGGSARRVHAADRRR